jgi:hypothetical protein
MHAEEEEEGLNSLPACLHSNPFCSFNQSSNKKSKDFNIMLPPYMLQIVRFCVLNPKPYYYYYYYYYCALLLWWTKEWGSTISCHSNWGLAVTSVVVFKRNFCFVAKVVIIHAHQDDVIIIFKKEKKKVAIIPKKI